jgi:hypothetical protein
MYKSDRVLFLSSFILFEGVLEWSFKKEDCELRYFALGVVDLAFTGKF